MRRPSCLSRLCLILVPLLLAAAAATCEAQTFLDKIKIGRHKQTKQDPVHPCFGKNYPPCNMVQFANCIDILEEGIRDDGIIVIQQPSVWGQARMTLYRKDFEKGMQAELGKFGLVLSARVRRTDQAGFESQTSLCAALSKGATAATRTQSGNCPRHP